MSKTQKFKDAVKAVVISGVVVPAMGVAAHFMPGKGTFLNDDASLAHRFECAYKMNPNPEHKKYTSWEWIESNHLMTDYSTDVAHVVYGDAILENATVLDSMDGMTLVANEEDYVANPFITGALYALVAGGAYAAMRQRKQAGKVR